MLGGGGSRVVGVWLLSCSYEVLLSAPFSHISGGWRFVASVVRVGLLGGISCSGILGPPVAMCGRFELWLLILGKLVSVSCDLSVARGRLQLDLR